MPPFGCNIASAGLLLGVFVAPRKDRLRILRDSRQVSMESWLSDAFPRDYLDLGVLAQTELEYISKEESDEWQTLFDEWDLERTYEGQVEYLTKAATLLQEVPIPPPLYYRWELRQNEAKSANEKLEQWRGTLMNQEEHFENAYERGQAGNLARCGAELTKLLKKMKTSEDVWTQEQYVVVSDALDRARQAAKQFFPTWLPREVVTDPLQFERFRHRMRLTAENLTAIGLQNETYQVEEHVRKVNTQIERLIRINTVINEVRAFLDSHQINAVTKVNEINSCLERIQTLEHTLREAAAAGIPVPQVEKATEGLRSLEKRCQEQLKMHKERAGAIWNTGLLSLQDVRDAAQEIRTLMTIYDGRDVDLQDFRLMIKFLAKFEEHHSRMDSVSISEAELKGRFQAAIEETTSMLGEDDEIPWKIGATYGHFLGEVETKRRDYAERWMEANVPPLSTIQTKDAAEAHRIRERLLSPPPVLNVEQEDQVETIRKACSRRLDDLKVEGLLIGFRNLSKDAQIEFLERAQQMLGNGKGFVPLR